MGDVHRLPFRDGAFDYVVCTHVLEHVERPERAIRELERVARRGYVETPSRANEKVLSHTFHRWTVSLEDGVLVFREKDRAILDPELQEWFAGVSEKVPGFREYYVRRVHDLGGVIGLRWEGEIPHRVERLEGGSGARDDGAFTHSSAAEPAKEVEEIADFLAGRPSLEPSQRAWSLIGKLLRRRSDPQVLLPELLLCPACSSPVRRSLDGWRCVEEEHFYPVVPARRTEIPYFVAPQEP